MTVATAALAGVLFASAVYDVLTDRADGARGLIARLIVVTGLVVIGWALVGLLVLAVREVAA